MSGSLAAACGWTLLRTFVLCLLAWPIIVGIERWLRHLPDVHRPMGLAVLAVPFLFPELLVGYTYRNTALAAPRFAELLCSLLLLVRIVPVGAITLLASPASLVSPAAIHCRWMLWKANRSERELRQLLLCYLQGPIRRALPALGVMSLVAFQEFELAALLQTASWTDWFIAAQRVGLERGEMISQSLKPVIMQLPMLAVALAWFAGSNTESLEVEQPQGLSRGMGLAITLYLVFALILGGLIPIGVMATKLPAGLMLLVRQSTQSAGLFREILIAALFSVCAGTTAWYIASGLSGTGRFHWIRSFGRLILLAPGLVGSLLLSLTAVVLYQRPALRPLYDTPIPWIMTLIIWLLPRAVLLRLWVRLIMRTESVHLAQMAVAGPPTCRSSYLLFRLRDQPQWLAVGLLCYWAYLDLSTAYLLAPSGMSSGLVRLYNFMHFGRTAALSAEAFLFFCVPIGVWFLVIKIVGTFRRR